MCEHLRDNEGAKQTGHLENCSTATLEKRRHCRPGKCRALQRGGAPCQDGACAHKAGVLVDDPCVLRQREFLSERLDAGRPVRCRPGQCRSLARRGVPCVPGQCVAKFATVQSADRLHEFVETHAHKNKADGRFWELVALHRASQAPSPETLNLRAEQAARLSRQQWDYVARNNPSALNDAWLEKNKRRARKKRQKEKKRTADCCETQPDLCSTPHGVTTSI